MANIGTVEGTLRLKDLFTPVLDKSEADLKAWGKQVEKAGKRVTDVGVKLSVGLTAPLLAAGAAATKFSVDMNRSMANVATLIPGNTQRVQDLKKEVQDLAIETGKSTADLSEGLYQTVSAFGDAADSAEKLRINARAAAGGLASTLESIDLTSAVTKGYGDTSAAAVEHAADLALATVRLGQTTFPQLAASMGRVIPIAQSMGQSQEELFAVFATATGVVGTANEVATQYRGVLAALLKPTDDLAILMGRMGFASGEAMLAQLGLVGTLQAVAEQAEITGKPITEFISQIEAAPLALALAGPQADTFRAKLDELGRSAGSVEAAFREQSEGINKAGFELQQAMVRVQVAWQKIGDSVAPVMADFLGPVAKVMESLASAFSNLPPPMQAVTIALAGIAAAAGPVLVVTGQLITAWGALAVASPGLAAGIISVGAAIRTALLGPLGLALAAVTALSLGLKKLSDKWQRDINQIVKSASSLGKFKEAVDAAIASGSLQTQSDALGKITKQIDGLKKKEAEAAKEVRRLTRAIEDGTGNVVENREELDKWLLTRNDANAKTREAEKEKGRLIEAMKKWKGASKEEVRQLGVVSETLKDLIKSHTAFGDVVGNRLVDAVSEFLETYKDLNDHLGNTADLESMIELAREFDLTVSESAEALRLVGSVGVDQAAELVKRATALREQLEFIATGIVLKPMDLPDPDGPQGPMKPGDTGHLKIKKTTDLIEEQNKLVREQEKQWRAIADAVSNAFGPALDSISEGLGDIAAQAVQLVDLFKAASESGGGVKGFMAGAAFGQGFGQLAVGLGAIQGNRGQSSFGGQMSGDYGEMGATVGAAIGTAILPGIGTLVGAVLGTVVGGAIKQGADEGLATLQQVGDEVSASIARDEGGLGRVVGGLARDVLRAVEDILDLLGAELDHIAKISFKIRDDTIAVFIGNIREEFTDLGEAIQFAAVQVLSQSDISGVGTAVRAALDSAARDITLGAEEFQEMLQMASEIDMSHMSDIEKELEQAFRSIQARFDDFVDAARDWGLSLDDVAKIGSIFADDWSSIRDSITGTTKSQRQIFDEQRKIFNARRLMEIANLTREENKLKADLAIAQAQFELQVQSNIAQRGLLSAQEMIVRGQVGLTGETVNIAHAMNEALRGLVSQNQLADMERQLAAVSAALQALEDIDPIAANEFRASGPSPAEIAAQDAERLNEILRRSAEQGLSDYGRAISEITRRWEAAIPLAHENQELLNQIAEARYREIQALREQTEEDLRRDIDDFSRPESSIADTVASISESADLLTDRIQDAMNDGVLDFVEGIEAIQEVLIAANEQLYAASQSGFAELAGSLAEIVQNEDIRARLIAEQERINFILNMQRLQAEYQALLGLGYLTQAQIDLLDAAFLWVNENMEAILAGFDAASAQAAQAQLATAKASTDYGRLIQQIKDGIAGLLNEGVGPFTERARKLQQEVEKLSGMIDKLAEQKSLRKRAEKFRQQLTEAFDIAVKGFADDILSPFEDAGLSQLEEKYQALSDQFWDIAQAFEELGIGAEYAARFAEVQLAALAAFWDDATSGIQSIIERLTGVGSGRAPLDLLAEQQADVEELFARAMSGDLSALEELEGEAKGLIDLINQVYGSGRAAGILKDQLLEMLEAVAGLDPSEVLDGSQGEAEPAFDIADYFSGTEGAGIQADMSSALKTHREEMQAYEAERDRVQMQQMDLKHQQDMVQRAELIRLTRELTKVPIKESGQMGA